MSERGDRRWQNVSGYATAALMSAEHTPCDIGPKALATHPCFALDGGTVFGRDSTTLLPHAWSACRNSDSGRQRSDTACGSNSLHERGSSIDLRLHSAFPCHVRDYHDNTNVGQAERQITSVNTIGERLKWARGQRQLTQKAVAVAAGVTTSTIGNLESGVRGKPRELNAIAKAVGAAPHWLETGKGKWEFEPDQALPAGAVATASPPTPYLPGFEAISIPLLAQSGSMGPGDDQMHDEVVVGRLTVSPQWVQRSLQSLTKLENLRFIHGYGDSMDPTFADGDILLVDSGVQDPKIDGVYVLEANDRIYIKRVRQRFDGSFEISSDNPTVKTVDVLDGTQNVNVKGRVVWAWNGKRL